MQHYIIYQGLLIALAAMQRGYIETLMPWINDPKATAGVLVNAPVTYEKEISWYESIDERSGTDIIFALLVRDTEDGEWRYVGHTGLHHITWPDGSASTGTFIGDSSVHGKGYGTEAKLWLLHHGFHTCGLRKVTSEVKAFNGNSYGHLLRCGYQVIGRRKNQHFHDGGYVDEILFEVFREDFDPIWNAYRESGELPALTDEQRALIKKERE